MTTTPISVKKNTSGYNKAAVVPVQSTGTEEMDAEQDMDSSFSNEEDIKQRKGSLSIRTCSISIFLTIILTCVITLTVIWVAFFSDNIRAMSKSLTEAQFKNFVQLTETTFREMAISSDTIKEQLIVALGNNQTDIYTKQVERAMNFIFFSEYKYHKGVVNAASLYIQNNEHIGILFVGSLPISKTVQNSTGLFRFPCYTLNEEIGCAYFTNYSVKTTKPYNTASSHEAIRKSPGKPVFTLTYKSPGIDAVLIALVNSHKSLTKSVATSSLPFDWFLHLDMSVDNLSKMLKNTTLAVPGSTGLIIEGPTNYIIATNYPEISITGRIQPHQHNNTILRNAYLEMKEALPNYNNITCNEIRFLTFTNRLTSVYRMCTVTGLDWIIMFSVPQWNYIGGMITAIIIALGISCLIAVIGILSGVFYSAIMVRPFNNLIQLFEHVADMNLESLDIKKSKFREVVQLQDHFLFMVQRIKQYRAFIPSHLLHQLEKNNTIEDPEDISVIKESEASQRKEELSSRVSRSTFSSKLATSSMFKIGFEKRKISSLMVLLDGFNYWVKHINFHDITHLLTDIFEVVQKACSNGGAHIGSFENETLLLSWNATEKVKDHEQQAVRVGWFLKEKLASLPTTKWAKKDIFDNQKLLIKFTPRFAVCTQTCHCGNVGTRNSKTFTIVGSSSNNLQSMLRKARGLKLSMVITETTNEEVKAHYFTRYVGNKSMIVEDVVASPSIKKIKKTSKMKIFEVLESSSVNMDEWMYELQSKEQRNKWGAYNMGCKAFEEGNYDRSLEYFREHESKFKNDLPTLRMIDKCERKLHEQNKF
ncbi:hypothetical protein C9374_014573 [Naegleria lovaniensis]|uniref:Guanylate cyclase domain-containing protein n=1 Tax=Naegleria lovaniensis TaxID=51637 RepID=A0AA88H168_NAELO|nr:uncharacterized protein C9374_014573 [Naegleria lovaniensis]KAG2389173.1 hypothetical protein C9374_014573 [Naegleria lovaniensis]